MEKTITPPPIPPKLAEKINKLKPWENPNVLVVLMGIVTLSAMIGTYFISQRYEDPYIAIISVSIVAGILTLIGGLLIHTIEKITLANRLKTEFVSIASHQLRTPLSGIKWYLELLLGKVQSRLSPDELSYIQTLNQANERMIKLVNDLLNVSRIDQGRMPIQRQSGNIVKIFQNAIEDLKMEIDRRKMDIKMEIIGSMPDINFDQQKIKIAADNLLTNAIKYSQDQSQVLVKIEQKGNKIIVAVQDWGVGIPANDKDKIFTKYFRANNVLRLQTSGTGLGLFITKAIIESHGGKIWLKTKEKQGSTFSFSLPII